MFRTLMLTLALSVAAMSPTVVFADDPAATQTDLLSDLKTAFEKFAIAFQTDPKPAAADLGTLSQSVEDQARKVLANAAATDQNKQEAYAVSLTCWAALFSVDLKEFKPKFSALLEDCRKSYPGSNLMAGGDAILFQTDMAGMDSKAFLAKLTDYQKTYPKSEYGPALVEVFAMALVDSDLAAARDLVKEAQKIYAANPQLDELSASLARVGEKAELSGPDLDGNTFDIASYKGKVVVIDFWATWCGPCKAMTPKMLKLYNDYHSKGLEIVGVSLDRGDKELRDYVAKNKIGWKNIFHAKASDRSDLATKYGVSAIPTLFVIDKNGDFATVGVHDFASVEKAVIKALK